MHGQKWSILPTLRPILLQLCVRSGFQRLDLSHPFEAFADELLPNKSRSSTSHTRVFHYAAT